MPSVVVRATAFGLGLSGSERRLRVDLGRARQRSSKRGRSFAAAHLPRLRVLDALHPLEARQAERAWTRPDEPNVVQARYARGATGCRRAAAHFAEQGCSSPGSRCRTTVCASNGMAPACRRQAVALRSGVGRTSGRGLPSAADRHSGRERWPLLATKP